MAKILILLLGVLFLLGKCGAQEGSGGCEPDPCKNGGECSPGEGTDYTCECIDGWSGDTCEDNACSSEPCQNGGVCATVGDSVTEFTCECSEEFIGETCNELKGCPATTTEVDANDVQQDYNCDNTTLISNDTEIVTVNFNSTAVGETAFSYEECNYACDGGKNRSVASRKCGKGGVWEKPQAKSCRVVDTLSNSFEDTNPDTASGTDINNAVTTLETETAKPDIPPQEADSALGIANNMIMAERPDAQAAVTSSSDSILTSVDNLAENVALTGDSSGEVEVYQEEQSNLGMFVISGSTSRAFVDDTYSYGPNGTWAANNLVASELSYSTFTLTGSYISAKASNNDDRLSFTMYSQADSLFKSLTDGISLGFVFGASGLQSGSYTFRFQISDSSLTENMVQCMVWNRTAAEWNDGDCTVTEVNGSYATFTTNDDGEYALKSVPIEATTANSTDDETTAATAIPVDDGLSPGAIAGIVVGSVVGVALIGGGVYYFAFHKKNKKKTAVSPVPQSDMEMDHREEGGNDNARYDSD